MIIWRNGEFVDFTTSFLHLDCHAVHYGTSVFEGCRAYNGKIFKLEEHIERLLYSAKAIGLNCKYSKQELIDACNEVLKKNRLESAYIRPIIFVNDGGIGMNIKNNSIDVVIFTKQWSNYYGDDIIKTGISLGKTNWIKPDPRSFPVQAKVGGNYFMGSFIQTKMVNSGYNDVLMLDYEGFITECSASNIFFYKNDEVHTPIADRFLNGITRQTIIELLKKEGIKVNERRIKPEELPKFDECFVTGTAVEVIPVSKIYDKFVYKVDFGLKLREAYMNLVNY